MSKNQKKKKVKRIFTWRGPSLAIVMSDIGSIGLLENSGKDPWLQLKEV